MANAQHLVFAIAGGDGRAIGSSNIIQLQVGGDRILFGYYLLPSTVAFQSAIAPGLTFNECPAIANTEELGETEIEAFKQPYYLTRPNQRP